MLGLFSFQISQGIFMIQPRYFILEFAAIVFLVITIPVWLPILTSLLSAGIGIIIILIVIGLIFSAFASSEEVGLQLYTILFQVDSLLT